MKKFLVVVLLFLAGPAFADAVAVQTVKIIVERIAEISVHGNPEIYLNIINQVKVNILPYRRFKSNSKTNNNTVSEYIFIGERK